MAGGTADATLAVCAGGTADVCLDDGAAGAGAYRSSCAGYVCDDLEGRVDVDRWIVAPAADWYPELEETPGAP